MTSRLIESSAFRVDPGSIGSGVDRNCAGWTIVRPAPNTRTDVETRSDDQESTLSNCNRGPSCITQWIYGRAKGAFPSTCPTASAVMNTEVGLQASEINPLRSNLKPQTYDRSPTQSTRSLGSGEASPPAFPPDGAKTRAGVKKDNRERSSQSCRLPHPPKAPRVQPPAISSSFVRRVGAVRPIFTMLLRLWAGRLRGLAMCWSMAEAQWDRWGRWPTGHWPKAVK